MSVNASALQLTRAQAKAAGIWRFGVGIPCPHGHVTGYRTDTGACTSCGGSGAAIMRAYREEIAATQGLLNRWKRAVREHDYPYYVKFSAHVRNSHG